MSDLAAAYTSLGLGLTSSEGREIIVENELLLSLHKDLVHLLHVEFGSEGNRC